MNAESVTLSAHPRPGIFAGLMEARMISCTLYSSRQLATVSAPPALFSGSRDYPVEWDHNDDGDLIVKITLPELRPREIWTSDDDDVVLVLRDRAQTEVEVTYTLTAREYDYVYEGEPRQMAMEQVSAFDSIQSALRAATRG